MKVEPKYGIDDVIYIPAKVVNVMTYKHNGYNEPDTIRTRYGVLLTDKAMPDSEDIGVAQMYVEVHEEDLKEYHENKI